MQHPALVGVMHGAGNGRNKPCCLRRLVAADVRRRTRSPDTASFGHGMVVRLVTSAATRSERLPQIRSFNQAHAEIVLTLVFADIVNRYDVRMREARCPI